MQKESPGPSIQSQHRPRQDGKEIRLSDESDISALLGVLKDSDCRAILQKIDDRRLSAQELATRCNLSLSTTYRKVNRLSQIGLIDEEIDIACDGKHTKKFQSHFNSLNITVDEAGFEVVVSFQSD